MNEHNHEHNHGIVYLTHNMAVGPRSPVQSQRRASCDSGIDRCRRRTHNVTVCVAIALDAVDGGISGHNGELSSALRVYSIKERSVTGPIKCNRVIESIPGTLRLRE
jgi:hypothetical protein